MSTEAKATNAVYKLPEIQSAQSTLALSSTDEIVKAVRHDNLKSARKSNQSNSLAKFSQARLDGQKSGRSWSKSNSVQAQQTGCEYDIPKNNYPFDSQSQKIDTPKGSFYPGDLEMANYSVIDNGDGTESVTCLSEPAQNQEQTFPTATEARKAKTVKLPTAEAASPATEQIQTNQTINNSESVAGAYPLSVGSEPPYPDPAANNGQIPPNQSIQNIETGSTGSHKDDLIKYGPTAAGIAGLSALAIGALAERIKSKRPPKPIPPHMYGTSQRGQFEEFLYSQFGKGYTNEQKLQGQIRALTHKGYGILNVGDMQCIVPERSVNHIGKVGERGFKVINTGTTEGNMVFLAANIEQGRSGRGAAGHGQVITVVPMNEVIDSFEADNHWKFNLVEGGLTQQNKMTDASGGEVIFSEPTWNAPKSIKKLWKELTSEPVNNNSGHMTVVRKNR